MGARPSPSTTRYDPRDLCLKVRFLAETSGRELIRSKKNAVIVLPG
jgi:hypothetical protein